MLEGTECGGQGASRFGDPRHPEIGSLPLRDVRLLCGTQLFDEQASVVHASTDLRRVLALVLHLLPKRVDGISAPAAMPTAMIQTATRAPRWFITMSPHVRRGALGCGHPRWCGLQRVHQTARQTGHEGHRQIQERK